MGKGATLRHSGSRSAQAGTRKPGGRGVNPDDAIERIVGSLHLATRDDAHWPETAALIDEACGAVGNILWVGEGSGEDERLNFARLLYRGEPRDDLVREYHEVYHAHDEGPPRHNALPDGRLVHARELYTEEERKTSDAYNEIWRRAQVQNALTVQFDQPDGLRIFWGVGDPVGGDGWQSGQVELVERVAPHVRQFVTMRQALAAADALGAGLAGLLENDRIGVVQLDRGGRVSEANGPGLEILRRGDGRRLDDGPAPLGTSAAGAAREPGGRSGGGLRGAPGGGAGAGGRPGAACAHRRAAGGGDARAVLLGASTGFVVVFALSALLNLARYEPAGIAGTPTPRSSAGERRPGFVEDATLPAYQAPRVATPAASVPEPRRAVRAAASERESRPAATVPSPGSAAVATRPGAPVETEPEDAYEPPARPRGRWF